MVSWIFWNLFCQIYSIFIVIIDFLKTRGCDKKLYIINFRCWNQIWLYTIVEFLTVWKIWTHKVRNRDELLLQHSSKPCGHDKMLRIWPKCVKLFLHKIFYRNRVQSIERSLLVEYSNFKLCCKVWFLLRFSKHITMYLVIK